MSPNQKQTGQQQGGQQQDGQQQGGQQQAVDSSRILPGAILIGVGLLALFSSVGFGPWASRLVLAVVFAGAAYFAYKTGERNQQPLLKWVAGALAILTVAVLISGGVGEALVVGIFALAFYLVWHRDRLRWWALIPAGALATIAVTQLLDAVFRASPDWLFLAGLAVTFYALTNLEVKPQRWAIYPAVALAALAALTIVSSSGWVGPILLIGLGVLLLFRSGAMAKLPRFGAPRVRAEPQGEPAQAAEPAPPSTPAEPGPEPESGSIEESAQPPTTAPLPDQAEPDSDADA